MLKSFEKMVKLVPSLTMDLLNKTTFTEYRYNQLYVANRCCCVALTNRILFLVNRILSYLFGPTNYFLRDAAGPISIEEEQAAIREYNNAMSTLLVEHTDKTISVFDRALNKRAQQLYTMDQTLTQDSVWKLWESKNQTLFQKACAIVIEKAKEQCQIKLEELVALFAKNRDLEEETLKSAIKAYAEALENYVAEEDWESLYAHLNGDVFEACCASNRALPTTNDPRYIRFKDILSLKWDIFQLLPIQEGINRKDLFLKIFARECEHSIYGKNWDDFLAERASYSVIIGSIAYCVLDAENIYRKLGLHLKQIDEESSSDARELAELIAFYIFSHIDEDVMKSCREKYKNSKPPDDKLGNFLTAHHSFTHSEKDCATIISRIMDKVSTARAKQK